MLGGLTEEDGPEDAEPRLQVAGAVRLRRDGAVDMLVPADSFDNRDGLRTTPGWVKASERNKLPWEMRL